jgi:Protein of unknown function (DUF1488)
MEINMALVRFTEGYAEDLQGIAFGLKEQNRERTVRFIITREAISDVMRGNPSSSENTAWFEANRERLEELGAEMAEKDPTATEIRITSRDLNPEQWAA